MQLAAAGDSVAEAEPAVELSEPEEEIDAGAHTHNSLF
jgi:hypothetical protein